MARKNDNNDFFNLEEFTNDLVEEMVVEERQFAVETFMKAVTQPTDNEERALGETPVDSGKLMANTIVSINKMDRKSYNDFDIDGTDTYVKAMLKSSTAPTYSKVYIQNNAKDSDTNKNYSSLADLLGWAQTPAYKFFTLSAEKMFTEVEKRK